MNTRKEISGATDLNESLATLDSFPHIRAKLSSCENFNQVDVSA